MKNKFNEFQSLSEIELMIVSGGENGPSVGGAVGFVVGVACCFVCKFGKELGALMAMK